MTAHAMREDWVAMRCRRLSRYAEDRIAFNALVRLRLAVKVQRPDGRVGYWLTPPGAVLFHALLDADALRARLVCGGAR